MKGRIKAWLGRWRQFFCCIHIKPGVFTTAAGLVLAGAGGAVVTPAWSLPNVLWNVSLLIGIGVFVWGARINDLHVWQAWWRGRSIPFRITAGVHKFDYAPGSTVSGIDWQQGFSHVYMAITNDSPNCLENVDVLLAPEHPIIRSSAHCEFADCRIAPLHGSPQVTILYELPGGKKLAEPHDRHRQGNYAIDPAHRLHCDRLPSGAEVSIDLATVVPEREPSATGFWKRQRSDPAGIRIRLVWTEAERIYGAEQLLELKGADHERF